MTSGMVKNKHGALAGVAAAAIALGVGELAALLVNPRSSPLVAVGGVVIDNVPESVKVVGIRLFGTYDKLALQLGTMVLLGAIAAALGIAAQRRILSGLIGIGVFGVIGAAAALSRVGADVTWASASVLAAVAAGITLWLLLGRLKPAAAGAASTPNGPPSNGSPSTAIGSPSAMVGPPSTPIGPPRRTFLTAAWSVIAGAAVMGIVGRSLGQRSSVNAARTAVTLPPPTGRPAVAPSSADVAGLRYTTANDVFYRIDTALVVPRVDPAEWTLKIHGRVRRPLTLTFDELLRRPMVERYVTLACVSNGVGGDLIGNARWLGVPLADLLDEVEPEVGADQVVSRSVDGFTAGTPTAVLRDGRDAMIAVGMNGEPLPLDHGFPARMVVPGLYGYVSATKWLAELELTTFADFDAYWIPRGWSQQAPIKTQSRIDRPRSGSVVPAGPVILAGVAWAQHRGIARVEVSVDEGPWQLATLADTVSIDTWRLWSLTWQAPPGRHSIRVRATDNAGEVQTEVEAPPAPDGATGWHTIDVRVE